MKSIATRLTGVLALAAIVGTMTISTASAAVLYSQTPLAGGASYESTYDFGLQNGDTFALANNATVDSFEWWGTSATEMDGFSVRLFDRTAASAAAVFECGPSLGACAASVTRSGTGFYDDVDNEIFSFRLESLNIALSANTTYVFSVGYEPDYWYWLVSDDGDGVSLSRNDDTEAWVEVDPDMAFAVYGTPEQTNQVPEPGTLALLGLAAGVLGTALRQRRK